MWRPYLIIIAVLIPMIALSASVQFKRGPESRLPASGLSGEPIWTTDSHKLFVGTGSSKVDLFAPFRNSTGVNSQHRANTANPHQVTAGQVGCPTMNSNWTFDNLSAVSINIIQGETAQELELAEALWAGSNSIIIKPMENMSTTTTFTFGNHGLLVNGVPVQGLSW